MDPENIQNEPEEMTIRFYLNGSETTVTIHPWETASEVLRNRLDLKGVKIGCGIGECGACTIIVEGKTVNSCLIPAAQLDGRRVETVEGLAREGTLNYLQRAFRDNSAVQCGFCTPGTLMSAKALLDKCDKPSREQIIDALSGNLCRCAGYVQIIEAVEEAARKKPQGQQEEVIDR
jgi:aerobic carbon-monoxide dehydrogenase small subunit